MTCPCIVCSSKIISASASLSHSISFAMNYESRFKKVWRYLQRYHNILKNEFCQFTHIVFLTQFNDTTLTKVVLTDNDKREIQAVETVFPNAKHMLCHFHVLCAVSRKLDACKLGYNYHNELYSLFRSVMYANTLTECDDGIGKLIRIGKLLI